MKNREEGVGNEILKEMETRMVLWGQRINVGQVKDYKQ